MGNWFTQVKNNNTPLTKYTEYDNWHHYAVNGVSLKQIDETIRALKIDHYKFHTMFFSTGYHHYVAFKTDGKFELPNSWQPTAAPFSWFLKNGNEYTDVGISYVL